MASTSVMTAGSGMMMTTLSPMMAISTMGKPVRKLRGDNQKNKAMTITREEIREDYLRFIRHEAMRANCSQDDIIEIITDKKYE